ncbi:unnamed protein product [Pedinophyceae sp. YPF-701]|nr:unnamed protein product [Pedinophyceae sp. YPF-701]
MEATSGDGAAAKPAMLDLAADGHRMGAGNGTAAGGSQIERPYSPALHRPARPPMNAVNGDHSRGRLLKDRLRLVKKHDADGRTRYEILPIKAQLSFDKGFYVFIRAIQILTAKVQDGVIIVGIAGPSGSGKTSFCEKIRAFLPGVSILHMDNYNDGTRVVDGNFDDPRLTDYDTLLDNLRGLREGRAVQAPIYDFKQSKRVGYTEVAVPSSRVVIIEGIYALSERLRPLLDLRVSITGGVHFDLVKRVLRDINRSGQAPEVIIQQVADTVYPMYKAFIEPDLQRAHLRVYNTFNPFSGFMDATFILKSDRDLTEAQVEAVLSQQEGGFSKETSDSVDIYLLPPHEDLETCTTWLRMRNREGRYSLMFEETVVEGEFMISPRISFEVSVRLLGGLMALGYSIGTIMKRRSIAWSSNVDPHTVVKMDEIEHMPRRYIQVQAKSRNAAAQLGQALGLEGTYIPQTYIEQAQMQKLTKSFQLEAADLRNQLNLDEDALGTSPLVASMSLGLSPPRDFGGRDRRSAHSGSRAAASLGSGVETEVSGDEGSLGGDGFEEQAAGRMSEEGAGSRGSSAVDRGSGSSKGAGTGLLSQQIRLPRSTRASSAGMHHSGAVWDRHGSRAAPFAVHAVTDVRKIEGTLGALEQKVDSIVAMNSEAREHLSSRRHSPRSADRDGAAAEAIERLGKDLMGAVATLQAGQAAQQEVLSRLVLQHEAIGRRLGELAEREDRVAERAAAAAVRRSAQEAASLWGGAAGSRTVVAALTGGVACGAALAWLLGGRPRA